jgi:succinyl-diaminopimelate desuccinylase
LHFVCDEETGSAVSSGHLRKARLIDTNALGMLTAEPTGGLVRHASRGAIKCTGRRARAGGSRGAGASQGQRFRALIWVAEPLAELAHGLLKQRTQFPMESDAGSCTYQRVSSKLGYISNRSSSPLISATHRASETTAGCVDVRRNLRALRRRDAPA